MGTATHTSQFSLVLPPLTPPTLASQAEQSLVPRKANRQSEEPCATRYYVCLPAIPQLRSPGNDYSVARRLNGNATHTVGRSAGSLSVGRVGICRREP